MYCPCLIEKFIEGRKHLRKKYPNIWGKVEITKIDDVTVLEVPSPQLLVGFSGYLKYHCRSIGKVYFRGEKCFYRTTIPSLFRDIVVRGDMDEIRRRKNAFGELVDELPGLYKAERFKKDNFSPLLQHYGIKTDWLDLVDNIFVALWFSNHCSEEEFSYIKFFVDRNLSVDNLRESNSSLSLRAHCQHGLSVTKKVKEWDAENIDFSDNLIAVVKVPNIAEMQLSGYIFSAAYMFPNEEMDNTYKLLKKEKFQNKLDEVTSKYILAKNALGQIK